MTRNYSRDKIHDALQHLNGWEYLESEKCLYKEFRFKDFRHAMVFMNAVSHTINTIDHHPEWSNIYNRISVKLTTHDTGGVTLLDVQLANEMDKIALGV